MCVASTLQVARASSSPQPLSSARHAEGRWIGVAGILQVASILGGGLVLFTSSTGEDSGGYAGF